jgi:two-component system, response regulator YesN
MLISLSYKDSITALQYKFYTGNNSIINITDINNIADISANIETPYTSDIYKAGNQLISHMKLGDIKRVADMIDEIFNTFGTSSITSVAYIKNLCIEIIANASWAFYELDENMDKVFGNRSTIINTIYETENVFDLRDYMSKIFLEVTGYFAKKYGLKNKKVVERIKEIIHERFRENIGATNISKDIFLTPNYICLIFKQETGETITDYITKVRIKKAKELLKTTDLKIMEIAGMVGYENSHYFSTVFKKTTGIFPQKYRS